MRPFQASLCPRKMVEKLKTLHVIIHDGNRNWISPEKGPNYNYFMECLKQELKKAGSNYV